MKNIHLKPTTKRSYLAIKDSNNKLELSEKNTFFVNGFGFTPQHIYITNDEEIKEGDWVYCNIDNTIDIANDRTNYHRYEFQKIILTTDPDLIKDGIQAIDDEFLEWFVKNPSCEFVPIITTIVLNETTHKTNIGFESWRKEEPKQIYYNTVGRENGVNVVKGQFNTQKEALDLANELNRKFPDLYYDWRETLIKEEPKQIKCYCGHTITCDCEPLQETLEEFIKQSNTPEGLDQFSYDKGLKDGAKWQQERMYSEEEVEQIFNIGQMIKNFLDYKPYTFKEALEQFKKK